MEEFLKNQFRLIECYRASSSQEEAETNCTKYADEMKKFVSEGGLDTKNVLKDYWTFYHKTQKYYKPSEI